MFESLFTRHKCLVHFHCPSRAKGGEDVKRLKFGSLVTLAVVLVAVASVAATATRNARAAAGGGGGGAVLTVPLTGTCQGATGTFTCFTGSFTLERFVSQNGALAAQGTLVGTVTDALGNVLGTVNRTVTLPVTASATCQILHLELGPLDLDLLGLQVHLNRVVLDITAQSGPGNLLGNLLCGLANLLNQGVPTNQLANVLNQILAILR
jgi:hypothetical protein